MARKPRATRAATPVDGGNGATGPELKTLFGKEHAGKILYFGLGLIFLLFVVSLGYFMSYLWSGGELVINPETYVFLFLLLLSIALFLTVFIGEKSSVKVAGMTFVGSAGVLAGLLGVFDYFSPKISGIAPPEFAFLAFECDQQQIDQKELVIKVEGREGYFEFLDKKLNTNNGAENNKRFLWARDHNYPSLRFQNIITKATGVNEFRVPIGFQFDHKLTILPVERAVADATAVSTNSGLQQPLMVIKIAKMSSASQVPSIDATFNLNVASYACKERSGGRVTDARAADGTAITNDDFRLLRSRP